jgi:hypothetical protein
MGMRLSGDEGFGAAFPLQLQGFLVFSELAVYGRGAYRCEFSRDAGGDAEGRPAGVMCKLFLDDIYIKSLDKK